MKLEKVVNALPALQKLAGEDLTPKCLYPIYKLLTCLNKELEFFNKEREKLFRKYGEDKGNNEWRIKPENEAQFRADMKNIIDVEIDGNIQPVKIPLSENISLSYNDLVSLKGIVELVEEGTTFNG